MITIAVTNPGAVRTKNRRKSKSRTYKTKLWKENVAAFIKGKSCEWCGSKDNLLAHHPYQDTPDGVYSDLYLSGCVVVCSTCHFMFHRRHKKRCPVCKTGWMPLDVGMCYACNLKANPEKAAAIAQEKERREADRRQLNKIRAAKRKAKARKHPCKFHRIRGICGKSAIKSQCLYSPRKAMKMCDGFEVRKVKR